MPGGSMNQYLDVNLSTSEIKERRFDRRDQELYVGGRGLGIRMLYDETEPGLDPFDENMVLIFSVGPLTGTGSATPPRSAEHRGLCEARRPGPGRGHPAATRRAGPAIAEPARTC